MADQTITADISIPPSGAESPLTLYIGNYNYSSWSLRAWLVLTKAELPFQMQVIDLDVPGYKEKLLALSEAGTVPVLKVHETVIADSLAICEFAARAVPNLWPKDPAQKQRAKKIVKQMHGGFTALRREAPMNLRRRTSGAMPRDCLHDAAGIDALWSQLLGRHNGPFLFDSWTIADAFFTPVATRFASYDLPRSVRADTYISELMSDPDYLDWEIMAFGETHVLPRTDRVNLA